VLLGGLAGCASNMHSAHHQRGGPMHMSSGDMQAMRNMHNQMMSGKTPEQRRAIIEEHAKSMSPDMRHRMEMMQHHCK
jgi:hypothetical protein